MAEVTSAMGAELRASALAAGTSVAAEVGRRLERLQRVETKDSGDNMRVNWDGGRHSEADVLCDLFRQLEAKK